MLDKRTYQKGAVKLQIGTKSKQTPRLLGRTSFRLSWQATLIVSLGQDTGPPVHPVQATPPEPLGASGELPHPSQQNVTLAASTGIVALAATPTTILSIFILLIMYVWLIFLLRFAIWNAVHPLRKIYLGQ